MLSEKDRREYKQGIYDLYSEVGTTKILYYPLAPVDTDDIYSENEDSYLDPISLVGVIDTNNPVSNTLDNIPNMGINNLYFDIPILSFEKHKLDPYSMLKGYFEFDNIKYQILDVVPQGMFTDFYTTYKFKVEQL